MRQSCSNGYNTKCNRAQRKKIGIKKTKRKNGKKHFKIERLLVNKKKSNRTTIINLCRNIMWLIKGIY